MHNKAEHWTTCLHMALNILHVYACTFQARINTRRTGGVSLDFVSPVSGYYGPITRCVKLQVLRMRRECRERFPCQLLLTTPTCISAHASRTCHNVCRDSWLAVFFGVVGGENAPDMHSRRMRNPQIYASGKRPMQNSISTSTDIWLHLLFAEAQVRYVHKWMPSALEF